MIKKPRAATKADQEIMIRAVRFPFNKYGISFEEERRDCGISFIVKGQTVLSIDWCQGSCVAVVSNLLTFESQKIISDSGKSGVPARAAGSVIEKLAEKA